MAAYLAPAAIGGRAYLAPASPPAVVTPPQADTIKPTFDGALAHIKSSSSITVDWSGTTSSDNVAVARREYRVGGSGPYTPASSAEEVSKQHTFAGLAPGAAYQIDVRCVDTSGNVSDPLSISVTTSTAAQPDGTPPTFSGSLAHTKTSSSITVDWSGTTSADNVAVARREYRIGGSGLYAPASSAEEVSKRHTFPGLASSVPYKIEVRCVDTSENVSLPLSIVVTTSAAPAPGGNGSNYIRCTLATHDGVLHVSLAVLRWALFAQLSPAAFGAPVAQGTHTMPAGSAELVIAVPAAEVPAGWYMLILADDDGTTALACPILVGP
jgi:chitodextrinase